VARTLRRPFPPPPMRDHAPLKVVHNIVVEPWESGGSRVVNKVQLPRTVLFYLWRMRVKQEQMEFLAALANAASSKTLSKQRRSELRAPLLQSL